LHDFGFIQGLIMGGDDKLSKKLLQVGRRHKPGIIVVARSNPIIVAGHDAEPVIRDLGRKLKTPLVLIPDRNTEKDFLTGYLDTLEGIIEHLRWKRRTRSGKSVAIVGYLFDRNEGDHLGNIIELKRILRGIGAKPSGVMLEGTPFESIRKYARPDLLVNLARGWDGAKKLSEFSKSEYLSTDIPIGLLGTTNWIRSLASKLALEKQAEDFIDQELSQLTPMLKWILPRFLAGKGAMVFADRFLLPPLTRFLEELGLIINAVGCTSVGVNQDSVEYMPENADWPHAPSHIPALTNFIAESVQSNNLNLIIGNSVIHEVARDFQIPFVELGYPSNFQHFLHPSPFLGFAGVRVLVERIVNSLQNSRAQSTAPGEV